MADNDNLERRCEEFKTVFEGAVNQLGAALKILEGLEAEKRRLYARPTYLGFSAALQAGQAGPNPWQGVRKADARLIRLLEAWRGNTLPRAERYTPPDVFGKPPSAAVEVEKAAPVKRRLPILSDVADFFNRPG